MSGEQLFDAWPERYRQWFETPIGKLIREFETRQVMDFLQPQPGEFILDAGCGSGLFTAPVVEQGVEVVGLDISAPMLHYARDTLPAKKFFPLVGSMLALPFTDGQFDKTVSITALEFIEDAQGAMNELCRVTKRGGRIVVATLNRLSPWAERREANARDGSDSVFRHTWFRSPAELRSLVSGDVAIRTAIHFEKSADPVTAALQEQAGEKAGRDTGAFVIAGWRK